MTQIEKIHVLIVDDSATIRNVIAKHLGEAYCAVFACNGEEAWSLLQSNNAISLVFVDLHMPVMNGMVLLKQIRDSDCKRISNLPVIMITGHEDTDAAKQASYNMGATDFISKPFSALDIISRAGSYTELNKKIATLEQNVTRDSLTALFNKRGLEELGDKIIASSQRHQFELSILVMQIENADEVLSKHGENIAEQIITSVANKLTESLRKEEELAHLGSGQFVILLPMTKAFRAHIVALRFQKAIDNLAFQTDENTIRIKLAVGLNSTEGHSEDVTFTYLFQQAEKALQASLQRRACNVVRHDETISKEQYVEDFSKHSSNNKDQDSISNDLVTDLQTSDTASFSNYMSAIMKGDFEKIPVQYIEDMVEPFESFLNYAYNHKQVKHEKI